MDAEKSNLIEAAFGLNYMLPDEAIICRHINNWIYAYGKDKVDLAITGVYTDRLLYVQVSNLCLTYTPEVVLEVFYQLYTPAKKKVSNG
jgi:hypothetical protein